MSYSSSDKTAENISLSNVSWSHTLLVTKNKDAGSYMVADDSDRDVIFFILAILLATETFDSLDDRLEDFCVIDTLLSLENSDSSLDTHSCIDTLSIHLVVSAVSFLSVSHEYIVPDFKVLSAMAARLTVRATCFASSIDEHLAVWSTRSCLASWSPPVVFTRHKVDSFLRNSKAFPLIGCYCISWYFVVAFEDCDAELIYRDFKNLCHKLERVLDHLFFEVIAERPVTQHFEECEMVWISYTIDVSCSDTLLIITKSLSCRMISSKKVWNKWMHSCCSEKDCRVVFRNKGSPADLFMAFGDEELNILLSQFIGGNLFHFLIL